MSNIRATKTFPLESQLGETKKLDLVQQIIFG